MQQEQLLPDLIYEYFVMRFRFQFYQYGDTLPTIEKLSQEFCVSFDTVKAALKRLREDGYITTQSRKRTKVVFSQSKEERGEYIATFLARRLTALPDLLESSEILFIPLLTEGLFRMGDEQFSSLYDLLERMGINDYSQFYCSVLQVLNNPLVMNLFWEIALFQGIYMLYQENDLHTSPTDAALQDLRQILLAGQQRNRELLPEQFHMFGKEAFKTLAKRDNLNSHSIQAESQLPFVWRIYWERPQICYNLAMQLLHLIVMGEYRTMQFLPSYQKLADSMHVSVITVRRTVGLLHRLGMVQPINGRGVRILPNKSSDVAATFADPDIKRNLVQFFHAYEILVYSCEDVTRTTFPRFASENTKELIGQLREYLESGDCSRAILRYLLHIKRYCPLASIREIYGKIYSFFLWGYPIKADTAFDSRIASFTQGFICALEKADYNGLAKTVREYLGQEMKKLEQYLLYIGLKSEELHPSSSIRLMLSQER